MDRDHGKGYVDPDGVSGYISSKRINISFFEEYMLIMMMGREREKIWRMKRC